MKLKVYKLLFCIVIFRSYDSSIQAMEQHNITENNSINNTKEEEKIVFIDVPQVLKPKPTHKYKKIPPRPYRVLPTEEELNKVSADIDKLNEIEIKESLKYIDKCINHIDSILKILKK